MVLRSALLNKKNGENISYRKIEFFTDYVEIKTDEKHKVTVQENELIGYFEGNLQKVMYMKPIVPLNEKSILKKVKNDTVKGFQYIEREEAGKINLYKEVVLSRSPAGGPMEYLRVQPSQTITMLRKALNSKTFSLQNGAGRKISWEP